MSIETILIVEDEKDIASLIAHHLEGAGFRTVEAGSVSVAWRAVERHTPDLIILDLMLPDVDGTDFCRDLKRRSKTGHIPVIMVTAKGEELDRVVGLELGADDYIVKPFSPRELTLRVKAVLRRLRGPKEEKKVLSHAQVVLDTEAHKVTVDGEKVDLTLTEFKLLYELMATEGRVRSRETLLNNVWGYTFEGYERTVDTHIQRLRRKLGDQGGIIQTVRGIGYVIREDRS